MTYTVRLGAPCEMETETRYRTDGSPVCLHHPILRVFSALVGFHLPPSQTFHLLRPVVVDEGLQAVAPSPWRYRWYTHCGTSALRVDDDLQILDRFFRGHLATACPAWCRLCKTCLWSVQVHARGVPMPC